MALASRTAPPQSKVELSRNAKGDVQIGVEVGSTDPAQAQAQAVAIFTALCEQFPRVNGGES